MAKAPIALWRAGPWLWARGVAFGGSLCGTRQVLKKQNKKTHKAVPDVKLGRIGILNASQLQMH